MLGSRSVFLAAVAAMLSACAGAPPKAALSPASLPSKREVAPPVVVTIVVDQLGAWVAEERLSTLPTSGGFARLLREGVYAHDVRYDHAVTDTAPGHAALYTAKAPRDSGIFANEVIDEATGNRVSVLRDTSTRLVTTVGAMGAVGSSIARLRVRTIADDLKAARPDAFVASISLKDRGAIFGGGRHPDLTLWFDTSLDAFVTSTAFASELPVWLRDVASHQAVDRARQRPWQPFDTDWLRAHAASPDAADGEGDLAGLGTTFPHFASRAKNPASAFRATPNADVAVFEIALAAARVAKVRHAPTLLALSLSANDYVGHTFGPDSWEAWDELAALDRNLAAFFESLDAVFGSHGYSVVLSADHGTISMPEAVKSKSCSSDARDHWERSCREVGGRIVPDELRDTLRASLKGTAFDPSFVAGVADPYVHISAKGRALPTATYDALIAHLAGVVERQPYVGKVFDPRIFNAPCSAPAASDLASLVCRSIAPTEGGALYVTPKHGSFFDANVVIGKGTSHGAPWLHDRAVPLIVRTSEGSRGAGLPPEIREARSFTSFDRTVSSLLGISSRAPSHVGTDFTSPDPGVHAPSPTASPSVLSSRP